MRQEQRLVLPEPWKEYSMAADEAEGRRDDALRKGDSEEASVWAKLARYCRMKADRQGPPPDQSGRLERWRALGHEVLPLDECVGLPTTARAPLRKRELHSFTRAIIRLILRGLAPAERACFVMIESELMDDRDVGAALEISPSQVRLHLSRARAKVRAARQDIEDLIPGPTTYSPSLWYVRNRAG